MVMDESRGGTMSLIEWCTDGRNAGDGNVRLMALPNPGDTP
jgi:hypothetical protein